MEGRTKGLETTKDESPVIDASEIESFVGKLDDFSKTLSGQDAEILMAALCSILDPFERMKFIRKETLLNEEELAILAQLKSGNEE